MTFLEEKQKNFHSRALIIPVYVGIIVKYFPRSIGNFESFFSLSTD